jgi:DNA-binding FrmR family transcriptional regulator
MKADRDKTLRLLKTARGQLDGIVGMIEDDRYCVDISNQLLATIAILRKANAGILRAHLGTA